MCIFIFSKRSAVVSSLNFEPVVLEKSPCMHWVDSPSKLLGWHHSWTKILAQIDVKLQASASGDLDVGRNDTWDVQKLKGSQPIQDINLSWLSNKMEII